MALERVLSGSQGTWRDGWITTRLDQEAVNIPQLNLSARIVGFDAKARLNAIGQDGKSGNWVGFLAKGGEDGSLLGLEGGRSAGQLLELGCAESLSRRVWEKMLQEKSDMV